jgi:hypothetical protein
MVTFLFEDFDCWASVVEVDRKLEDSMVEEVDARRGDELAVGFLITLVECEAGGFVCDVAFVTK